MKIVKLKFSSTSLKTTLAHPSATVGISGDVTVYNIVNVPNCVSPAHVIAMFDFTVIQFSNDLPVPYTVVYEQLGRGCIIYKDVLVRADQLPNGKTFSSQTYPCIGVRTCRKSWVRKLGGDKTVVIDCGEGISSIELSPSDVLMVHRQSTQ